MNVNNQTINAIKKIKLIRKCMSFLIVAGVVVLIAVVYRSFIDLCKKDQYLIESIKYLIFFFIIHFIVEFNSLTSLFYTLYRRKHSSSNSKAKTDRNVSNNDNSTVHDVTSIAIDIVNHSSDQNVKVDGEERVVEMIPLEEAKLKNIQRKRLHL